MALALESLPPEVLNIVLRYLDGRDLIRLSKCIDFIVTKEVYDRAFHEDIREFPEYNMKMFRERVNAHWYILPQASGRVNSDTYIHPNFELVECEGEKFQRVHTACRVGVKGTPVQVEFRERSFFMLTDEGDLFTSRMYPTNDSADDPYKMVKFPTREHVPDDYEKDRDYTQRMEKWKKQEQEIEKQRREKKRNKLKEARQRMGLPVDEKSLDDAESPMRPRKRRKNFEPVPYTPVPNGVMDFSNKLFSAPFKHTRLIQFARFDERMVALDEDGILWIWESDWDHTTVQDSGTPCCLSYKGTMITEKVLGVVTHGNHLEFLVEGGDVCTAYRRRHFKKCIPNATRGGYTCFDDHCCYIDLEGRSKSSMRTADELAASTKRPFLPLEERPKDLLLIAPRPAIQIKEDDDFILMLCKGGQVFEAKLTEDDWSERKIEEFEGLHVCGIDFGVYHRFALTNDGDVYSWGLEDMLSGCMGFGKLDEALKLKGVSVGKVDVEEADDTVLKTEYPMKAKLPGKAFAMCIATSHSAILVNDGK